MDALSALSMMGGPDMGTKLNSVVKDAAAKAIPMAELQQLNSDNPTTGVSATQSGGSFQNLLTNFVSEVNDKQNAASDAISGLLSGKQLC